MFHQWMILYDREFFTTVTVIVLTQFDWRWFNSQIFRDWNLRNFFEFEIRFLFGSFLRAFQIQEILEWEGKKSGYTSCIFFPSFFLFLFPSFVFLLSLSVFSEILTQIKLSTFSLFFCKFDRNCKSFVCRAQLGTVSGVCSKVEILFFFMGTFQQKLT